MDWIRTRLEVPAITGDPSVLLATLPRTADGLHSLTEQLPQDGWPGPNWDPRTAERADRSGFPIGGGTCGP